MGTRGRDAPAARPGSDVRRHQGRRGRRADPGWRHGLDGPQVRPGHRQPRRCARRDGRRSAPDGVGARSTPTCSGRCAAAAATSVWSSTSTSSPSLSPPSTTGPSPTRPTTSPGWCAGGATPCGSPRTSCPARWRCFPRWPAPRGRRCVLLCYAGGQARAVAEADAAIEPLLELGVVTPGQHHRASATPRSSRRRSSPPGPAAGRPQHDGAVARRRASIAAVATLHASAPAMIALRSLGGAVRPGAGRRDRVRAPRRGGDGAWAG